MEIVPLLYEMAIYEQEIHTRNTQEQATMLLSELDIAERINHPYFNGEDLSDIAKKKRVRKRAREINIKPVIKKHNIWLFHEDDLESLVKCRSKQQKEKDRRTGRSRGRSTGNAFEKVQELLTEERRT